MSRIQSKSRDKILGYMEQVGSGQLLCIQRRRRNAVAHILDGGLFVSAILFVAPGTVLPILLANLDAPTWLIALAPQLMMLGFMGPALLVAHIVDRMVRVMPFVVCTGVVQRLPYFIVGWALMYLDPVENRTLLLCLIAGAPFVSGLCGGLSSGAWQELVHRTIPDEKRAGVFAGRMALASILGLAVGGIITMILSRHDNLYGYGLLHILSGLVLLLSMVAFIQIEETPKEEKAEREKLNFKENMRMIPSVLRAHPSFSLFMIGNMLATIISLVVPFLAIFARDEIGMGDAVIGSLVIAQMIGGLAGNGIAGFVGDRYGGKLPMLMGYAVIMISMLMMLLASSEFTFLAVFFFLGMGTFMQMVGKNTLGLELAPEDSRSTCLSLNQLMQAPVVLAVAGLATWMHDGGAEFSMHVLVALVVLSMCAVLTVLIKDPRKKLNSLV